jgi:hypothetical protein
MSGDSDVALIAEVDRFGGCWFLDVLPPGSALRVVTPARRCRQALEQDWRHSRNKVRWRTDLMRVWAQSCLRRWLHRIGFQPRRCD